MKRAVVVACSLSAGAAIIAAIVLLETPRTEVVSQKAAAHAVTPPNENFVSPAKPVQVSPSGSTFVPLPSPQSQQSQAVLPPIDPAAHSSVRRMTAEARMLAEFSSGQSAATGASRRWAPDNYSSAVIPFGKGAAEPTIAKVEKEPTVDPMKGNPDLAQLTQSAQKELNSLVEAMKAVQPK